ncbi:dioxygenase [Amycolatopsis sp. NPDC005232]|uniref:dioxygenase family protein n=1 Tax=Amycolatopsis sp. NPDC005232 TaxID=3157027 RepID=UPI0033BAE142
MANARATKLFDEFAELIRDFITRNRIDRDDYAAVMNYVISVGEAGEWPLWLDAFFESTVDTVDYGTGDWTSSTIEGPYFKEGAPLLTERPAVLPMRPDEPGDPMRFLGTVRDTTGAPVTDAVIDVWHSTNDGSYSFFSPALPEEYLMRGKVPTADDGRFEFRSIRPVPYEIPKDGPTGVLMNSVLGRHSWRPAHLHFRVESPTHRTLITQLYFQGDPYLDSDSCSGVKDELVLPVSDKSADGERWKQAEYTFVLQPN